MRNKFIFLILTALFSFAQADILFIDLNNVEQEIKVAREAAAKRGEKLIVIPSDRDEHLKQSKTKAPLVDEQNRLSTRYETLGCDEDSKLAECQRLSRQYDEVSRKLTNFKNYTVEDLKRDLKNVPQNISTVMISGHDGEGTFYGEFGRINNTEFLNAFEKFDGRKNIRSLYLLGCYSNTRHTMGKLWKQAFPNAGLIAGYEEVGYLRDNSLGHQFIRNALIEEPKILAAQSIDEAQRLFRRISPKSTRHGTAACLQITDDPKDAMYLSSTKSSGYLADLLNCSMDKRGKAINYVRCARDNGTQCPLAEAPKYVDNSPECKFLYHSQELNVNNDLYALSMLGNPDSRFHYKKILAKASPELRSMLKLDQDVNSFGELKYRLSAVKDAYEHQFSFDQIKDMPVSQIDQRAKEKEYFDRAWLAVSNLDLPGFNEMNMPMRTSGAELRAQAFAQTVMRGDAGASMSQRIQQLEAQAASADSSTRQFLQTEISSLRKIQSESGLN